MKTFLLVNVNNFVISHDLLIFTKEISTERLNLCKHNLSNIKKI